MPRPLPLPPPPSGPVAPHARSVRLTELGRSVALLAIGFAGVAVPFEPGLLLLPAVILFALLVSAPIAFASLSGLRASASAPRTVVAGDAFEFELELEQRRALVRLRDATVVAGTRKASRSRAHGFVSALPPGSVERVPCRWRLLRRGRERRIALGLATSMPFGLWEARAELELEVDWLALPWLGTVRAVDERLAGRPRRRETWRAGFGDEEFYALREGREGDSLHLVHWRATARRSKLVVRELRADERPPVEITLDGGAPGKPEIGVHHGFERAVSVAATLVEHFVRERSPVRFRFEGAERWTMDVRPTRRSWLALLARLAEVQPVPDRASVVPCRPGILVGWRLEPAPAGEQHGPWRIDVSKPELAQVFSAARRRSEAEVGG
jgi:uncharacterized protein (DUF58 family)